MASRDETLRVLETGHNFPCRFSFKVIGENTEAFSCLASAAVGAATGSVIKPRVRRSTGGSHQCLTFVAAMDSAAQVLEVFAALREVPGVRLIM